MSFRLEYQGRPVALAPALMALEKELLAKGLKPGQVVADAGGDSLRKLFLLLLLPRLGSPFLPLDPALPAARRRAFLQLANAGVRFGEAGEKAGRPGSPEEVGRGRLPKGIGLMPGQRIQLLVATSGTSGDPRLVALSAANLRASAQAANQRLELGPGDNWLVPLPQHHVGGLMAVLRAWLAGAGMVLELPFRPDSLLARLGRGDVTHLSLVPTQLHRLLRAHPGFRPPPSLRAVLIGGAPLPAGLAEQAMALGWPLCPTYGLTEAASQVATAYPPPRRWYPGLSGKPLSHLEVALDVDGRIRLRGDSLAPWILEEEGARALADEKGWFTTGDLGVLEKGGELRVLGRADEVIITGGEKVHPAVVEGELARCPGIESVAVVGVEDAEWGERAVACYQGSWNPEQVADWARQQLQGAHRPREFHRLECLPRNNLGKLERRRLRQWLYSCSEA